MKSQHEIKVKSENNFELKNKKLKNILQNDFFSNKAFISETRNNQKHQIFSKNPIYMQYKFQKEFAQVSQFKHFKLEN